MADNVELNAGSGGATAATDEVTGTGEHIQLVKLAVSADGSRTLISADGDGILVNLGANNDITGTVTANLGATDNAVLDSIQAAVETIDNAISGTEMQVDVVAALPAGTNNIGDVDVATLPTTVHSADFDTGAGTDTTLAFGIAVPASGGAAVIPGDATAGLKVDLGSDNDVTVTGTVTANLSATDNAVLDAIESDTTTIAGAVSGTEMQVDVVTSALPTGAATSANQSTIIGHLDGVEGLLTTIDSDTGTLAGAVAGSEVQVDVVAALPAGANSIGNVGLVPRTSGGMTIFRSIDIDESEEEVKATAGQLFSISAFNTTAAPLYLKFYNLTAANTTVGTSTPVLTFVVPGNADSDGAGFVWNNEVGFAFGTAITVACTTGVADNDTGAPGANACVVNLGYA